MTQSKFDEAVQLYKKAGQEQKVTFMSTNLPVCAYIFFHIGKHTVHVIVCVNTLVQLLATYVYLHMGTIYILWRLWRCTQTYESLTKPSSF